MYRAMISSADRRPMYHESVLQSLSDLYNLFHMIFRHSNSLTDLRTGKKFRNESKNEKTILAWFSGDSKELDWHFIAVNAALEDATKIL